VGLTKIRARFKQKIASAGIKIVHAYKQKNKASASLIIRAHFKQQNAWIASPQRPSKKALLQHQQQQQH